MTDASVSQSGLEGKNKKGEANVKSPDKGGPKKGGKKKIVWRESRLPSAGEDDWLGTYADSITLLMCFFAIFFNPEAGKPAASEAVQQKFGGESAQQSFLQTVLPVVEFIKQNKMEEEVKINRTKSGFEIEIQDGRVFASGAPGMLKQGAPLLDQIVTVLNSIKYENYKVMVENHTDDSKPSVKGVPTNWELAALRSTNVAKYLAFRGVERSRLAAISYGEFRPKAENRDLFKNPMIENQKANRRLVVTVAR